FYSDRDGNLEIYVMNADGSDQTRLTTTTDAFDARPEWSPRKRGVEVSEDSIVISDASRLEDLTAQEVTAQVRGAVVRVETNLGSGSGFIIDSNGLIVTNNHVISDATEITIFLEDGTSFEGSVLGRDLVHDLAVVQIDATDLPTMSLGDLSQLPLASEVIVAGYPLGVTDLTITTGLVSSIKDDLGRNIIWVQTDAAVNPGNSGGPILNLRGEVVGIVTAKFVDITIEGVGFAISINTIKLYLEILLQGETIPG
ncbi:MAG: trypsin-like peptidase domain-containing protein, partial [Chloroflexi bacterium]|nr:trypsin-like peptidase domain-containing protein [Chloroflexota bacterium]